MKRILYFNIGGRVICILLFLLVMDGVKAQKSIETNILIPIANALDSKHFGGGFDVSYNTKVYSQGVMRFSIYHRKQIMNNDGSVDYNATHSSAYYRYFKKDGFRIALKNYRHKRDDNILPYGYYWGCFTDLMYAQSVRISKEYDSDKGYSETTSFGPDGIFLGSGFSTGYTFKFNHLIVEPNIGIGVCFNNSSFNPNRSKDKLASLYTEATESVFHIELHIGYAF